MSAGRKRWWFFKYMTEGCPWCEPQKVTLDTVNTRKTVRIHPSGPRLDGGIYLEAREGFSVSFLCEHNKVGIVTVLEAKGFETWNDYANWYDRRQNKGVK